MVSGKGLLYTALGAAAAAVIVGVMLTPEKRSQIVKYAKDNSGPLLDKAKTLLSAALTGSSTTSRTALGQGSNTGHA